MKKKTRWWLFGGLAALLLFIIIIGKTKGEDGTKVAIETVEPRTIIETVVGSGKIYPETEVKISPEVSGEIVELNVEEGDSVQKGEVLLKINASIYNSMVEQAHAGLQQTKAGLNNAQDMSAQSRAQYDQALATYNRNKTLYKSKVISAVEFEQAEANYKSAKATYEASKASVSGNSFSVQASRANLDQAKENLRKTTIVAPTSGVVSSLSVKKGERVVGTAQMAGTELLTIADLGRIEVRVDVGETDISKVKLGDTTIIEADAYRDRKFKGIVSKIAVSSTAAGQVMSTEQVTNYTVNILILPESYADLITHTKGSFPFKPGMSASVEIQTKKLVDVLGLPVNAVTTREWPDSIKNLKNFATQYDEIRQVVFVYNPKTGKVKMANVKTGIQDNENIQILSGLKKGEQVVVAPYGAIARTLNENSKVIKTDKDKLFDIKEEK